MKRLAVILAALVVAACGTCRRTPTVVIRDSIRVEYRERIIHDTARIEVPKEVEKIVTRDTSSHLVNGFAESDAVVSGGFLHHSLRTKPQVIKVPVLIPVRDTIRIVRQAEVRTETVEVEKPLSWWQRFRLGAFWWLLLGVAGLLLWTFRKPLLALVRP